MVNTTPDIHSAEKFDKEAEAALLADLREQETSSEEASQVTPPPIVVPTTLDPSVVPPPETTPPPVVTEPPSYSEQIKEQVKEGVSATALTLNRIPPNIQDKGRIGFITGLPIDVGTLLNSSRLVVPERFEKGFDARLNATTNERDNIGKTGTKIFSLALQKYDAYYGVRDQNNNLVNEIETPENLEENRNIHIAKVLKYKQIPYYGSQEEALEDEALSSYQLYAVKGYGENTYPIFYEREKRGTESASEMLSQFNRDVSKAVERAVISGERHGLAMLQAVGSGGGEILTMIPALAELGYVYGSPELAYAMYGSINPFKRFEVFGGSEGISEEYAGEKWKEYEKTTKQRKELISPFTRPFEDWKQEVENAYIEHPVWKGVNSKRYFAGRAAKLFVEESVESRLFAAAKFLRGRRIFKNILDVDLNDPKAIAEKLNISTKQAAKRIQKHKLGHDSNLQRAYILAEQEAGIAFALGYTYLEETDEQGNPIPSVSGTALAMAGGLISAILLPGRAVGSPEKIKNHYDIRNFYFKLGDKFRKKPLTPDQHYRRQRLYLRTKGLTDVQINKVYKEKGPQGIEDLATNFLTQDEHGDLRKLLDHINNMGPESREELVEMADVSFEALSKVQIAGKEIGIDTDIFVDQILNLNRLHQLREQIFATKHGMFSSLWSRAMNTEYKQILDNDVKIQETLVGMIEKLNTYVDTPTGASKDEAARHHVIEFVNWANSVTNKLKSETFESFNSAMARNDIELSDLSQSGIDAKFRAINSISPIGKYDFKNQNVRADDVERRLVGRKQGEPILEVVSGKEIPAEGIFQRAKNEADRQWDQIDFSQRIDSREFFQDLFNKYADDPDMAEAFSNIITNGMSPAKTRRVVTALIDNNLNRLTVGDLPELKRIYKEKTIGDDPEKLREFNETFGFKSNQEQLDMFKQGLVDIPLVDKLEIIPADMSLQEIKRFNTYLNQQAIAHSGDSTGYMYREIRNSLNNMLETAEKDLVDKGMSADNIKKYTAARIGWREHAKMWKNGGPMEKILWADPNQRSGGSSIFKDAFLKDPDSIYDNSERFFTLRKGIPSGVKEDGTIIYTPHSKEDLKMIDEGLRHAIAQGIHDGDLASLAHLTHIRSAYGSITRPGGRFLSRADEEALDHLIYIKSEAIKPIEEAAKGRLKEVGRAVNELNKVRSGSIDSSFLSQVAHYGKTGDLETVTRWFTNPHQIVYMDKLTDDQAKIFKNILDMDDGAIRKMGVKDTVKGDGYTVTPLQYLKIKTNNFTGTEGRKIKEHINSLLLDHVVREVIIKTDTKEIAEDLLGTAKLALRQRVDVHKLDSLLDRIGQIRKEIFEEEPNTLLDAVHQGALARLKTTDILEATDIPIPKGWTESMGMSRMFALQRGVIGLRYVIGEATLKELRKGQAKQVRKLLSDPDAAAGLLVMLKDPEMLQQGRRFLGSSSLQWSSSIRALAYVTGLKIKDAETLFTEEEAKVALLTGEISDGVLEKAHSWRHRRKRGKGHFGGSSSLYRYPAHSNTMAALRDEMNSLGLS